MGETIRLCVLLLACGLALSQQSSTTLMVDVRPEARLSASSVALRFALPQPQPATVTVEAWARPLPGQRVTLIATPGGALTGARESIPPAALRWTGVKVAGRGGGQAATCTSGAFDQPPALTGNWSAPGRLTCTFTFALSGAERFAAGVYTGNLHFDLRME